MVFWFCILVMGFFMGFGLVFVIGEVYVCGCGGVFWYVVYLKIVFGECMNFFWLMVVYCLFVFGMKFKVINMCNGFSVVVCVNDCGFFVCGWVFDLLKGVVSFFNMVSSGMVKVCYEVVVECWVFCLFVFGLFYC